MAAVVIGAVDQACGIDEHVGGLDHLGTVGPVVHQARGRRRHQRARLLRSILIANIEHALPHRRLAGGPVHAGNPVPAGLARVRGIVQIHGHEDVIGKSVEQGGDIGPRSAGIPDAVDATALDRHEADAAQCLRFGDVIDREPRCRREVVHGARPLGIAHIDDAESFGEHAADVGDAAMHHDLHAVRSAALLAMGDEAHVARVIRFRQVHAHGLTYSL